MPSKIHSSKMVGTQRQNLHPEFLENESSYWKMRDEFLSTHQGRWIAYDQKRGILSTADSFLEIGQQIFDIEGHPYVVCVGKEDDLVVKTRRIFLYDSTYTPTPLPQATVTFSNARRTHSQTYEDVIPDTGADLSVVTEQDVHSLQLDTGTAIPIQASGVTGSPIATMLYPAYAAIDGAEFTCFLQILPGRDRILGRDVLNQLNVRFDGPENRVEFLLS